MSYSQLGCCSQMVCGREDGEERADQPIAGIAALTSLQGVAERPQMPRMRLGPLFN